MEKKLKKIRNWAIAFTVLFCVAIALMTSFIFEVPWLVKVISEAYNDVTSEVIGDGWIVGGYVSCGIASGIFLILFVTLFSVYGVKMKNATDSSDEDNTSTNENSKKESEKLMRKRVAVENTEDVSTSTEETTAPVKMSKRKLKKLAKAAEEATESTTTEETTTEETDTTTETSKKTASSITKQNMEKFYRSIKK